MLCSQVQKEEKVNPQKEAYDRSKALATAAWNEKRFKEAIKHFDEACDAIYSAGDKDTDKQVTTLRRCFC